MTSAQHPEPKDTLGGPDPGGEEDEFAEPGAPGPDTLGGRDPGGEEDEFAEPGPPGPDTLGGPDLGPEDELRPGG